MVWFSRCENTMSTMKQSRSSSGSPPEGFALEGTLLFKRWEAMKQEILLHKWYESERRGYDIGWEKACIDWQIRHGRRFRSPGG